MEIGVTIIMPVHNSATVKNAICSILNQTHRKWELIVIDDNSSCEHCDILREVIQYDKRISLIMCEENRGPGVCRNIGLDAAKYDIIAFCDADDFWHSKKLEIQLGAMLAANAPISCTGYCKVNLHTKKVSKQVYPPKRILHKDLLKSCAISMSSAMVNKRIVGDFSMPTIRKRQDYAMWLDLTRKGYWVLGCKDNLVELGYGYKSVSSNKLIAAYFHWKVLSRYSTTPLILRLYYFQFYAFRGMRKYFLR